jgi:hypothetical protein
MAPPFLKIAVEDASVRGIPARNQDITIACTFSTLAEEEGE